MLTFCYVFSVSCNPPFLMRITNIFWAPHKSHKVANPAAKGFQVSKECSTYFLKPNSASLNAPFRSHKSLSNGILTIKQCGSRPNVYFFHVTQLQDRIFVLYDNILKGNRSEDFGRGPAASSSACVRFV